MTRHLLNECSLVGHLRINTSVCADIKIFRAQTPFSLLSKILLRIFEKDRIFKIYKLLDRVGEVEHEIMQITSKLSFLESNNMQKTYILLFQNINQSGT